jgi:beta-galactosidase
MDWTDDLGAELSRRQFLRASAGGAAGLAAWAVLGGQAAAAQPRAVRAGAASIRVPLNIGWLFGQWVPGSRQPGFDESGFVEVTLPHTVTPLSWRNWDPSTWERLWIYMRHFDLPPPAMRLRTFVDFEGALTSAYPAINGVDLPPHYGGYLPFSYELTDHLQPRDNLLAIKLDSTWQNVPPEGKPAGPASIDFLEPGGLYRNASLRLVPHVFLADLFALPTDVLSSSPGVRAQCTLDAAVVPARAVEVVVALYRNGRRVASASEPVKLSTPGQVTITVELGGFGPAKLWSPADPQLYEVVATVYVGRQPVHDFSRRIGFREALFTTDGFFLNGSRYKLFGLDRHQIFPYSGMAMPERVQRHDAEILKSLNCNMVRMSHYPQAPAFLDACDELGIQLWEEIPGWGYLGDAAWQQIMLQNVHDMVVRDRSRPSVIIWGVSPNEAPRDPSLYAKSQQIANSLDGSRPTSGTQTQHNLVDWNLEVFAFDDYTYRNGRAELQPPIAGVPYLVTEAVGAIDPPHYYQWTSSQGDQQVQALYHAQVHNLAGSKDAYCGLLAWAGFDYDSLSGYIREDIKWPGVVDTFRVEKPGSAFYQAEVDPSIRPVVQPAFYWDFAPASPVTSLGAQATVWSNCDRIEAYVGGSHYATLLPDIQGFPYVRSKPFYLDTSGVDASALPDLRLDGYLGPRLVVSRTFSADRSLDRLALVADDIRLVADGSDATRVAFRSVDRYGNPRPYPPPGDVEVGVEGPASWLGEVLTFDAAASPQLLSPGGEAKVAVTIANGRFPFQANGGVGAVWVRTLQGRPGRMIVTASHPTLGKASATILAAPPPPPPPGFPAPPPEPAEPAKAMTFEDLSLGIAAPPGWTVTATLPTSFSSLPPGSSATATWAVRAPTTVTPANAGPPSATAAFTLGGRPVSKSTAIPLSVAVPLDTAFDNVGISDDSDVAAGNLDGVGNSYSAQALAYYGHLTPGATFTHDGVTFTWPDVAPGKPDNVLANGQTILLSGSGTKLGFVGSASPSDEGGTGTVHYTDGTGTSFEVVLDNYFFPPDSPSNEVVVEMPYINDSNPATNGGHPQRQHPGWLYYTSVAIAEDKQVLAVTLPLGGGRQGQRIVGMHIFAIGVG